MAFYDQCFYCNAGDQSTTGHYAVAKFAVSTAYAAGQLVRQLAAPAVGSERVFVVIVAGTSAASEPAWTVTRGAKTTSGTVTFQECTGASAVNGDLTNTPTWSQARAIATAVTLGAIIQRNNGASYWICSTAGTMGASEPAWANNTAGTTQTDSTVTWTCLGVVGNFTGGQAPFARLASACATTWFAAGNTIYVGDNHAESQATIIQLQPTGSLPTVGRILCHNHSGSYPPASSDLTTGATISTTGTVNILFSPSAAGGFYLYGLTFRDAIGQSSGQNITLSSGGSWIYCDRCLFDQSSSGSASIVIGSGVGGLVTFNNTTVKFGNVLQGVILQSAGQFIWQNTGLILVSGSSLPNNLITSISTVPANVTFEALDLSQLTGNIITTSVTVPASVIVKDCKFNAATAVTTPGQYAVTTQLVRCDSGATSYKSARYTYEGTETTETSITRVGGAADPAGQAQSRKIVTTANSQWLRPFRAEPYAIWNAVTGSNVTVTVCGTINAGTLPNNDDIWLEVEYLGSSATPLGTIVTTTKSSVLAANAAVASDGSTWNGGGSGAGWLPFKLTTTLSSPQPGMAGYINARVRAAKASATFYIDPQIVLS
jgi:hypothetical protein